MALPRRKRFASFPCCFTSYYKNDVVNKLWWLNWVECSLYRWWIIYRVIWNKWVRVNYSKITKNKIAEARRASAISSLLNLWVLIYSKLHENKNGYLLIIYKWQFLSLFQCFMWQMEATLLDENLKGEFNSWFKRKNSFTLSKSCIGNWAISSYSERKNLITKQRKNSLRFWCGFLAKCFSSGWETVCKKNTIGPGTSYFDQNAEKQS